MLWLGLCRQLSYEWRTNDQYAYGWFVPVIALALFLRKWRSRPSDSGCVPKPSFFTIAVVMIVLLGLLPLRVIQEINQDWSSCNYLLSLAVVGLSLYVLFRVGGWPWVKHFAFATCFILVAVNWPARVENSLKCRLMGAVAAATVEIAGWLNIPALQHGNTIELSNGWVGVDEACSGIRSLQSTIMASLLLGELYFLSWPKRALLLAMGAPVAFCLNIVRVLFLTWRASVSGNAGVHRWHDSAGFTILAVSLGCLWLLAGLLSRGAQPVPGGSGGSNHQPIQRGCNGRWWLLSQPFAFMSFCGVWGLCIAGVTEGWYRAHEIGVTETTRWSMQCPDGVLSPRKISISKEIAGMLKSDQGEGFAWEEQDGSKCVSFFFRWRAGEASSRIAARDHRPEVCLPSRGCKLKSDLGIHVMSVHGLDLPFRTHIFQDGGRELYVFFCLWEDGAETQVGLGRSRYLDRLESVLAGRRRLGQQTLEIIVSGSASLQTAEGRVKERLGSLILVESRANATTSPDVRPEQ